MATMPHPSHFQATSGSTDSVWIHTDPYEKRPTFQPLAQDLETDVCIVGTGIAGMSIAYELVTRGVNVVMLEARDFLSGETSRTSGHLSNALDDGYIEIEKTHGFDGAKAAADSHTWALQRVGEISKQLGIDCEYRLLPAIEVSQYPKGDPKHDEEIADLKAEVKKAKELGLNARFEEGYKVKGWEGAIDQRDAAIFEANATFHPTKYVNGLMRHLKSQPNFQCYTHTAVVEVAEKGIEVLGMGSKSVKVSTGGGNTVTCQHAVEATCVPLQKLSVIAEMEYMRTYCIAIRVPKGSIEDCLLYDEAEAYKYIRFTACDEKDDYLVIGGCDHAVGQEKTTGRFEELETWVRERFPQASSVDYKWSGQIFEPVDHMAFIGKNSGQKYVYIVTGDSGNGLTHGVLAGKLIADEIQGVENPWAQFYDPKRKASIVKKAVHTLKHDLQINAQYKRFLQSDIQDIEDLVPGEGGVLNPKLSAPMAVYKDDDGTVHKFSALCPHLKGVVSWNTTEKSWDCPVHGSRFSKDGMRICGPAKLGLSPMGEQAEAAQAKANA
jgi:glycine/D-amino acid oxidase-like deaminating enzyme/nitrite reductase/ring-hydroxylating ferredoxin subunit